MRLPLFSQLLPALLAALPTFHPRLGFHVQAPLKVVRTMICVRTVITAINPLQEAFSIRENSFKRRNAASISRKKKLL